MKTSNRGAHGAGRRAGSILGEWAIYIVTALIWYTLLAVSVADSASFLAGF